MGQVVRRPLSRGGVGAVVLGLLVASAVAGGQTGGGFAHAVSAPTVVSITFDDGHVSAHGTLEMLRSRGMVATYYVTSGRVGASSRFMTWSQIDDLARAGNEIGGHTAHHVNLTTTDATTARREVCDDRQALLARGYGSVSSFAYPWASGDRSDVQIVRDCGYTSGRGVGLLRGPTSCLSCPWAESIPPADPYALRTPRAATTATTLQDLQHSVTGAEQNGGGWVPFVFHGICNDQCTGENSMTVSLFTAFLDWLQPRAAMGTVVRTVGQVMGGGATPGPSPSTSPTASPSASASASPSQSPTPIASTSPSPTTTPAPPDTVAPVVSLTQPTAGSTAAPSSRSPLAATATDSGGSGMARVVFWLDGRQLTTVTGPGPSYTASWNTQKLKGSTHVLYAQAVDAAGNSSRTADVTVTIAR